MYACSASNLKTD